MRGSGQPYIYTVYTQLWPTLHISLCQRITDLANPTHITMSKDHRSGQAQFGPTLHINRIYTVLANPTYTPYIDSSGQPYIYTVYTQFWPTLHISLWQRIIRLMLKGDRDRQAF